jgi:hypothetical protein
MIDRRALILAAAAPFALRAADGDLLRIRDLYEKDMSFSDLARRLDGSRVDVQGYMAPPLRAEASFFVLTLRPMAVCPFCETEAQWPDDILAVYTKRTVEVEPFNAPIATRGVLRLGMLTDADTGFVSRIRIEDAAVERI